MIIRIDRAIYANANALDLPIGDKSVHMIATSPPYWGLRSYDTGDQKHAELGAEPLHDCLAWARGDAPCGACYVCNMRTWAREMWRVLRDDGVMFLNLGDSYAAQGGSCWPAPTNTGNKAAGGSHRVNNKPLPGLKPKDLTGIPWRVALALQADGWYLRSDIIWAKPNPMPESVTDRPTKAHEYVFLLTKSARYYWDAEAVREGLADSTLADSRNGTGRHTQGLEYSKYYDEKSPDKAGAALPSWYRGKTFVNPESGRNLRTVWNIATAPYSGTHYATWPPALVDRMVKAGSSERGVCPECGKPWERITERGAAVNRPDNPNDVLPYTADGVGNNGNGATTLHKMRQIETTGWRPTCTHDAAPVPAIVLDPFCGSGTTLMIARQLGRIGLGFDLSLKYLEENAAVRLGHDKLAAWGNGIKDTADYGDLFANGATR